MNPFRTRNLLYAYLLWWLAWTCIHAATLPLTFGFSWSVSWLDALATNVVLGLAGYIMFTVLRFYQPRQITRLAYSLVLSLVSVLVSRWLIGWLSAENGEYLSFLYQSFLVRLLFSWLILSLVSATAWLWFTLKEQEETRQRKEVAEGMVREAELTRLRQQLQPHFLFNSLNSISALAVTRPEEARKMIQQLSDFLRGTLRKEEQQLILLDEEFQHLKLYLEIEKVRFGHRLETVLEHPYGDKELKIPPLLIQPVVENAIKFGLYDTIGKITIQVHAAKEDHHLLITVTNPFDPQTAHPRQGTGFGLDSIRRRLYLLYARHDLLTTTQSDGIFTTRIKIPQHA